MPPATPVDVVLEDASHATVVLAPGDGGWVVLKATVHMGTQNVLAQTDRLGTFAASPQMPAVLSRPVCHG